MTVPNLIKQRIIHDKSGNLLQLFTQLKYTHTMFTGLVEIMGTVSSIQEQDNTESGGNGWTITVSDAAEILGDCHLGDSIAINGKTLLSLST